MLKVARCGYCNKVYRSGLLRQVIEKELPVDLWGEEKNEKPKGGRQKFEEKRVLVCKICYRDIEKGKGIYVGDRDVMWSDDKLKRGWPLDEGDKELLTPARERKSRGKKIKAQEQAEVSATGIVPLPKQSNEEIEAAIAAVKAPPPPEPPKKRGRPKKAQAEPFAGQPAEERSTSIIPEQGFAGLPEELQPTTNTPAELNAKAVGIVHDMHDNNSMSDDPARAELKQRIRTIISNKPTIMYEDVAKELSLGVDYIPLIEELMDEITAE